MVEQRSRGVETPGSLSKEKPPQEGLSPFG
jgi:hypothetical protein